MTLALVSFALTAALVLALTSALVLAYALILTLKWKMALRPRPPHAKRKSKSGTRQCSDFFEVGRKYLKNVLI